MLLHNAVNRSIVIHHDVVQVSLWSFADSGVEARLEEVDKERLVQGIVDQVLRGRLKDLQIPFTTEGKSFLLGQYFQVRTLV